jgi:CRP/FNR family transcriptional regulator, dissimilatory nitrate respiration regulator
MGVSLTDIPLFAAMDVDHVRELALRARVVHLSRGEALFLEGDRADGFYVVRSGRLKVYKSSPAGREQILHLVEPGDTVGEVAMFAGQTFPATAEALGRSDAVFIPKRALLDMVTREPEVAMVFLTGLSRRLREFTSLIEALSLREVSGRLAAYLLYQSRNAPGLTAMVVLPMPKAELASLLGTVPETLSRAFQRLSTKGLVSVRGRTIHVKNRPALQKAAWSREEGE